MKEITLKFREVAVDGLPKKSGYYAVLHRYSDGELQPDCWTYSDEYKLFNVYQDVNTALLVDFWIPIDELNESFKEDAQDVQTLD